MGLTIHYSFQSHADNPQQARHLIEQLRQRAVDLPFQEVGEVVEIGGDECGSEDVDDPQLGWLLIQAGQYLVRGEKHLSIPPERVIAFSTWPGEGCEAANFGLCRYPTAIEVEGQLINTDLSGWSWFSFCKTQYASNPEHGGVENFLRCHLSVVAMLNHAAQLGILKDVSDEGGYWDNRDAEALVREVGEWNAQIAAFVGRMKDAASDHMSAEITSFPDFEPLEAKGNQKRNREREN